VIVRLVVARIYNPLPLVDIISAVMVVWMITGKIIRTVFAVLHVTISSDRINEQFLQI